MQMKNYLLITTNLQDNPERPSCTSEDEKEGSFDPLGATADTFRLVSEDGAVGEGAYGRASVEGDDQHSGEAKSDTGELA